MMRFPERWAASLVRTLAVQSAGVLAASVGLRAVLVLPTFENMAAVVFQGRYLSMALSDFASWTIAGRSVVDILVLQDPLTLVQLEGEEDPGLVCVAPSFGGRLDSEGRAWLSAGQVLTGLRVGGYA